jgi:hypothetical protein
MPKSSLNTIMPRIIPIIGGARQHLTYSLKADSGLDYSILKNMLMLNFDEKDISYPYVDLSWGEVFTVTKNGRETVEYPPEFERQRADLKFLLESNDLKKLTEKSNLIENFKNKEFLAKSYQLKDFLPIAKSILNGKVPYIVKKNIGYQQKSVRIILTYEQLIKAKEDFGINCIVSHYIQNTMQSHGKKFHLRPYFLLYANPTTGVKKAFTFSQYRMITAKKKYTPEDDCDLQKYYDDVEIHMSGGHHTDRLLFPSETDIPEHLIKKSLIELKKCTTAIENNFLALNLRPYPESKAGFQVVCADILLTEDGHPYILEINRRCGFSYGTAYEGKAAYEDGTANKDIHKTANEKWKKMNTKFSTDFFHWVYNSVIQPHFRI